MPIVLAGPQPRTYGRTCLPAFPRTDEAGISIIIRIQTVAPHSKTPIEPITEKIICQIQDGMVSAAMPWVA